jgi:hypothetical protein
VSVVIGDCLRTVTVFGCRNDEGRCVRARPTSIKARGRGQGGTRPGGLLKANFVDAAPRKRQVTKRLVGQSTICTLGSTT